MMGLVPAIVRFDGELISTRDRYDSFDEKYTWWLIDMSSVFNLL